MEIGMKTFQEQYIKYLEDSLYQTKKELQESRDFQKSLFDKGVKNVTDNILIQKIVVSSDSMVRNADSLLQKFTSIVSLWKTQMTSMTEALIQSLHTARESNELDAKINEKRSITARVAPRVKGHVISVPRVRLSRLDAMHMPRMNRLDSTPLTPITEVEPNALPGFDDVTIIRDAHDASGSPLGEGSSASARRSAARKSGASTRQSPKSTAAEEAAGSHGSARTGSDQEVLLEDAEPGNVEGNGGGNETGSADPLEGPSWLLDEQIMEGTSSPPPPCPDDRFVTFRRKKCMSAKRIKSNHDEDNSSVLVVDDELREVPSEAEDPNPNLGGNSSPALHDASEGNEGAEVSSCGEMSSGSPRCSDGNARASSSANESGEGVGPPSNGESSPRKRDGKSGSERLRESTASPKKRKFSSSTSSPTSAAAAAALRRSNRLVDRDNNDDDDDDETEGPEVRNRSVPRRRVAARCMAEKPWSKPVPLYLPKPRKN